MFTSNDFLHMVLIWSTHTSFSKNSFGNVFELDEWIWSLSHDIHLVDHLHLPFCKNRLSKFLEIWWCTEYQDFIKNLLSFLNFEFFFFLFSFSVFPLFRWQLSYLLLDLMANTVYTVICIILYNIYNGDDDNLDNSQTKHRQ